MVAGPLRQGKAQKLATFPADPSYQRIQMTGWHSRQETEGNAVTGSTTTKQVIAHHTNINCNYISSTSRIHIRTRKRKEMTSSSGRSTVSQSQITRQHIRSTKSPIRSTINPKTFFSHKTSKHLQYSGNRTKRLNEVSQLLAQRSPG